MEPCSICFEDINENDKKTINCNHVYHEKCIEKWFSINHQCPLCRKSKFDKSMEEFKDDYYKNSLKIKRQMELCSNKIFRV